jgi:protein-S-isoprenylcysteine O-methyltransferase Ste14
MNVLPEFSLSLTNAFWCSLLFIITNILVLKLFPAHYKKRVLKMPSFEKAGHRIIGTINFFVFQGLIGLAFIIKWQFVLPWFALGAALFLWAYVAYVISLVNYASCKPERPVTKGIYRFSRNPQQLATIVMWVGVGFMASSWLIVLICGLQMLSVYPTFIAQEQFCKQKYGKEYMEYMKKAPRYVGVKYYPKRQI